MWYSKKKKHVGVCVCMCVCEWLNLLGKGNDWMSRGPDDCDGEVKPTYSVYTKRMQQQTNVFFLCTRVQTGRHLPDADLVSHFLKIKNMRPRVARIRATSPLTAARGISIALMARKEKHSLAYLECINNNPSGGSMSLGVINKTFALALITAAAPW